MLCVTLQALARRPTRQTAGRDAMMEASFLRLE